MAHSVYSERFLAVGGNGVWHGWGPPADKRAILTEIACTNGSKVAGGVQVYLGGPMYYWADIPATETSRLVACRVVLYGGELLQVFTSGVGITCTISGYLFNEDTHVPRLAPPVHALERKDLIEGAEPLPSR